MHVPSQVRLFRSEPLPDGVLMLLRIAAGDEESEQTAVASNRSVAGQSYEKPRCSSSSRSCLLLTPTVIGCSERTRRQAPANLDAMSRCLLRWLHPDFDPRGERSVFIGRVTTAWNNLKTPERRTAYDEQHCSTRARRKVSFKDRQIAGQDGKFRSRRLPMAALLQRRFGGTRAPIAQRGKGRIAATGAFGAVSAAAAIGFPATPSWLQRSIHGGRYMTGNAHRPAR